MLWDEKFYFASFLAIDPNRFGISLTFSVELDAIGKADAAKTNDSR